jgi:hypothetical protein
MPLPKPLLAGSPVVPSGGLAPTTAGTAPAGGAAAVAPGKGGYPFMMQTQLQDNWCWAAVATSASLHYNSSSGWTQCRVANNDCVNRYPATGTLTGTWTHSYWTQP